MKQDNENWQRLSEVIRTTGHNVSSFAKHIGLPRGKNLYQIQRGNNGISLDVAMRIHDKYPEYPIAWLMFGIEQLPCGQVVRIPLYYLRLSTLVTCFRVRPFAMAVKRNNPAYR